MSEEFGYSPSFKRPSEIMRMRRKRSRSEAFSKAGGVADGTDQSASLSSSSSSSSVVCVRPFLPGPLFFNTHCRSGGGGVKRRNPFANIENRHSPRKKCFGHDDGGEAGGQSRAERRTTTSEGEVATKSDDLAFLQLMEKIDLGRQETRNSIQKCLSPSKNDSVFEETEEDVKTPLQKSPQVISPLSIASPVCTEYPADWSLKTRLLFTSSVSLSWSEQPKAQEEALGLSQHCRAQFSTLPHNLQDPKSSTALRCAFQQSLIYWQHPSLSWVPLFPRINAERSFAGKNTPWAHDAELQRCLMSEWSTSLSSLYSLLKARLCPYFYVCAHQYTVLFRAAGLGGSSSINALISPTTRGLREAMRTEGIEFSVPLMEQERMGSKSREQVILCDEEQQQKDSLEHKEDRCCSDGCDEYEDRASSLSWLEEMGVQDKIKKPDTFSSSREEGRAMSVDHKPESVVCVEGPHTFTLVNFLINCKTVVAATGSQAGLPPTLLAPVPFRGATMNSLKARCLNVKSQVASAYQNISSMEITGPVLPSSLHGITTLLRLAQKGNFSAILYTHAPTAVLNIHGTTCASGSADVSAFGLHPASIKQLQQSSSLGKTALTQITMNNYSYTWKK
ncbi:protein downstream neighbor of son homolog isoform X2 [Syngnathoides biaculeatus]|uniref:protein downstream neighbor of son homolog isoform X2 n=1 Tax=Syngnathoides biaculeatus TaxID=300417 RepID=UPI002ADD79AF|nr:protein downstream neighbor of son homolog isoform X2 [Syngnathoides biaculeatus]